MFNSLPREAHRPLPIPPDRKGQHEHASLGMWVIRILPPLTAAAASR